MKLSDRFGFELLKDTLGEKLTWSNFISTENVLLLLTYADMYQATRLLEKCCTFVDSHAIRILCSDAILTVNDRLLMLILSRDSLCVPETQIFQTVVRWKERNEVNEEVMKGILDCVRLTELTPQVLFSEIEASGLFESGHIMQALRVQMKPDIELMKPRGIKC